MKRKKLGLVHTSATLVPVFAQLCKEKLPNVDVFNIADDSLVKGIREAGCLTATIARRVAGYLESAELAVEPLEHWSRGESSWTEARQSVACRCDMAFGRRLAWANRLHNLMFIGPLQPAIVHWLPSFKWSWNFLFSHTRCWWSAGLRPGAIRLLNATGRRPALH